MTEDIKNEEEITVDTEAEVVEAETEKVAEEAEVVETKTEEIVEEAEVVETKTEEIVEEAEVVEAETEEVVEEAEVVKAETEEVVEEVEVVEAETEEVVEEAEVVEAETEEVAEEAEVVEADTEEVVEPKVESNDKPVNSQPIEFDNGDMNMHIVKKKKLNIGVILGVVAVVLILIAGTITALKMLGGNSSKNPSDYVATTPFKGDETFFLSVNIDASQIDPTIVMAFDMQIDYKNELIAFQLTDSSMSVGMSEVILDNMNKKVYINDGVDWIVAPIEFLTEEYVNVSDIDTIFASKDAFNIGIANESKEVFDILFGKKPKITKDGSIVTISSTEDIIISDVISSLGYDSALKLIAAQSGIDDLTLEMILTGLKINNVKYVVNDAESRFKSLSMTLEYSFFGVGAKMDMTIGVEDEGTRIEIPTNAISIEE